MTPSFMRIQRRANCASVAPGGTSAFSSSTAAKASSRWSPRPLKVSPGVEGFAALVEVAVVVGGEGRVARHLAAEQAAGQRHAREDADALLLAPRRGTPRPVAGGTC